MQGGVEERTTDLIKTVGVAAYIQAFVIVHRVQLRPTKFLWAEEAPWANIALNHTVTTANLGNKSKCGMQLPRTCLAAPVPSPSILSLEAPIEVVLTSQGLVLHRAGHRPPNGLIADVHASKQAVGLRGT